MSLFDLPHCPNCHSEIDLMELWQAAPKSGNTFIGRVAIACPVCGVKLRVLQSRAYLIGLLAFLVPLALIVLSIFVAPVTRGSIDDLIRKGILVVVVFGAVRLHKRNIPKLLTVRLLQGNETVRFPLVRTTSAEDENEAEPNRAFLLEPTEDQRPVWVCPKCREENPGNFDVCWKCQAVRLGVETEISEK
jgi:hypothetical protein